MTASPDRIQEPSKVALVHDYLLVLRGAERTFAAIADCWPEAPIFTTLYSPRGTEDRFAGREVRTSYLQRLGVGQAGFRRLLPLFPGAVERFDLGGRELVVSSSSAFAHGVRPAPGALHVCYCHTPFRYAWHERGRALAEAPRALRWLLGWELERIRRWDRAASERVSAYIANSELVRERIGEIYGREATVVHPPVAVERFAPRQPEDYFLVVGELVPHKRVEVALEAARLARVPLKVVGEGPELRRLRAAYGGGAEFIGRVSDETLADLYARARALVVPNVEEFGIAAVEAQAAGRPVLALGRGGARETVVPDVTGVLVGRGDPAQFAAAMREVDFDRFAVERIRAHAMGFSSERFQARLRVEVARAARLGRC